MTHLFFAAVRATLFEFLHDPVYLGAHPGIIVAMQTWCMALLRHIHCHCLVTAGGVAPDGTWLASGSFLLPGRAASVYFRGTFLNSIEQAISDGELVLPPELSNWPQVLRRLHRKKWNVSVQARVSNPAHVLKYLGRYICGGPIGNSRLVSVTESSVTFRHTRDKDDIPKTLERDEFIGRLLSHVPLPRQQLVRNYGLYANNHPEIPLVPSSEGIDLVEEMTKDVTPQCCPTCGAKLVIRFIPRDDVADIIARCRASPEGASIAA